MCGRDRIVAGAVARARLSCEAHNANFYVGGDIASGANDRGRRCSARAWRLDPLRDRALAAIPVLLGGRRRCGRARHVRRQRARCALRRMA